MSLPLLHPEDENIPRIGRETWSQVQAPNPNPATTNPISTNPYATKPAMSSPTKHQPQGQEITRAQNKCHWQKKKNHDSQKKVQDDVLTQPTPSTPTSTTPAPTVATINTQTPVVRSTAESILVHKLAMGQFPEVPHPTTRSLNDNLPPLEDIPSAPVRQGTPWPNAGLASENLFKTRKDWTIPPTPVPTPAPTIKTEEQSKIAAIPSAMVIPKQATEKCSWGPHCPICKNEEEHGEEDWDGDLHNQPRMCPQKLSAPPAQATATATATKLSAPPVTEQPAII